MNVNAPLIDQRSERTNDRRTPEDGNMDCVPTSLASMVRALVPGASLDGTPVSGDGLHDLAYGDGYVGMQDPARFQPILRDRYGVQMTCLTGPAAALVARAMTEILAGHPVLLAIPSDWSDEPPTSGYVHMVAGCDTDGATWLTAMNPWGGFYQRQSVAWWVERLARCAYQGIWVLVVQKGSSAMAVPADWHDDGKTLTAPNGEQTAGWIRQHVIDAVPQWPTDLMPVAPLYGIAGGWQQDFAASRSVVATTAGATSEKAGPNLPTPTQVRDLEQQVQTTLAHLTAAQDALAPLQQQLATANAEIEQLKKAASTAGDPTAAPLRAAMQAFLAEKGS